VAFFAIQIMTCKLAIPLFLFHACHTLQLTIRPKLDLPHHAPPYTQCCCRGGIGRGQKFAPPTSQ